MTKSMQRDKQFFILNYETASSTIRFCTGISKLELGYLCLLWLSWVKVQNFQNPDTQKSKAIHLQYTFQI